MNVYVAAECIEALAKGGDPDDPDAAYVGGFLVAEFLALVRAFAKGG